MINYFKTDQIFHNLYLDNLETAISTNPNLTTEQNWDLILPLYKFGEFPKKLHNGEKAVMGVFKTVEDKYGLLTIIKPLQKRRKPNE